MDYARAARHRHEVAMDELPEPVANPKPGDPWLEAALRKLVASLPDEARMVIVLRYEEDMEPQEIATLLGLPIGTVKSRLRRSLVLLRGKVSRLTGEPIR
jgi:RNA polymerase sigma-70 factor (ECF subfamily)